MTKEKKIIVAMAIISILVIAILSYFLINKNAIIEKQAEEIKLQAMETNGSNSYITMQEHLNETSLLNSSKVELLWTNSNIQAQATFTATCDWSKYDKIIILNCYHYTNHINNLVCCDIGNTLNGWSLYNRYYERMYRSITFKDNNIEMYATIKGGDYEYNIPLKIWGIKTDIDMYTYP